MKVANDEIREVRTWGHALIMNGMLVILLMLMSSLEWIQTMMIYGIGMALVFGGMFLLRCSDETKHLISNSRH